MCETALLLPWRAQLSAFGGVLIESLCPSVIMLALVEQNRFKVKGYNTQTDSIEMESSIYGFQFACIARTIGDVNGDGQCIRFQIGLAL